MTSPQVLVEVRSIVTAGDAFFREQHGRLYDAILAVGGAVGGPENASPQETDDVRFSGRVVEALRESGQLESIGGAPFIESLQRDAPAAGIVIDHARQIRNKARLRQLIDVASAILSDAYGSGDEYEQVMTRARERFERLEGVAPLPQVGKKPAAKKDPTRRQAGKKSKARKRSSKGNARSQAS